MKMLSTPRCNRAAMALPILYPVGIVTKQKKKKKGVIKIVKKTLT